MLERLYNWYGRKTVWGFTGIVTTLVIVAIVLKIQGPQVEETVSELPTVKTASVSELSGSDTVTLLGTVKAVSEAQIQTESSGRVTSVPVALGDTVRAGQVIATLENASQRAAVLQAEGAYEAAVANASVSDVSVTQAQTTLVSAQNSAISNLQSTYNTVSNGFYSLVDDLYRDANSALPVPYIAGGNGSYLRLERVAFQTILPDWQNKVTSLNTNSPLIQEIDISITNTKRARALVDAFIVAIQDRSLETLNGVSVTTWTQNLSSLRASIDNSIISLESSKTSIQSAQEAITKAQITGTSNNVSTANAQVKQALGGLRAAQANLSKTIMTSPIAGSINELDVSIGDFVGSFQSVAKVANNDALEITVYVGESDLEKLSVSNTVLVDNQYPGVITNIGAGVDRDTQKTEVKIATETSELTNGDTVSVSLLQKTEVDENSQIILPISAIKFTAENGSVYTVDNNVLVEHPITVGLVRGGFVEVLSGVTNDMYIVVDSRGLTAGFKVEATQ